MHNTYKAWAGYHIMLVKTVTYNVSMTHTCMTMEVDQCLKHNGKKNKNKY